MKRISLISVILAAMLLSACAAPVTTPEPTPTETPTPTYTLSVSVNPSGAGSVSPPGGKYESGLQVTLTATPASGNIFDYWDGAASGSSHTVTITMNSDKSTTAHFKAVETLATPTPTPTEPQPKPAEFTLSNLQVEIGKTGAGGLMASVDVQNVGDLEGTYELKSKVDEEIRDVLEVELGPGEKKTIDLIKTATRIGYLRLMYERGEAGIGGVHIVSVGDLSKTIIFPEPTPTPAEPTPEIKTDREDMIEIFKANALAKWGDDYQMVNYEVDKQTEAYDWVVKQTKYPEIMERAKSKWQNDYEMVKYTYENQVEAYEWIMRQTTYPDIMERAKQKWGGDYEMVKYEYENQVEAYKALQ